ncbi:18692_t:CDS:2 [Funneliformis geosporum]|nr:18692_t:CDS:2 [Funneliformis geosporum]
MSNNTLENKLSNNNNIKELLKKSSPTSTARNRLASLLLIFFLQTFKMIVNLPPNTIDIKGLTETFQSKAKIIADEKGINLVANSSEFHGSQMIAEYSQYPKSYINDDEKTIESNQPLSTKRRDASHILVLNKLSI